MDKYNNKNTFDNNSENEKLIKIILMKIKLKKIKISKIIKIMKSSITKIINSQKLK